MIKTPRVAIFASGAGSNAEALIKKMHSLGGQVEFVFSDKTEAGVLAKAQSLNTRRYVIKKKADRLQHEQEVLKLIDQHQIDWILLAGYMRLLSPSFLKSLAERHEGRAQVVNIHPSLLPAYPGAHSLERAFADQVSESGVTLHLVDEGMDAGPVLKQAAISLKEFTAFADFKASVHRLEHQIYTEFLEKIVLGEIPTHYFKETVKC
ncbi:phosphoribosylglycinamide formyltransferase [Bdellovibrio sp. SKB1291214]|uniref:phosphoribosylglycinamide formyltransferase n=1 Tax=Bdellovibrio sp. SKB1291214 TaxID=1732569 RepID=UPI000B642006|nr:phosphoribosylglycinamide formyltransferase [Bdellovibrio sp. SKB1291214]UYL08438.1 phosphoribosylglycinamide formyltransferase [Bdellovibrio sp. SKB1291214]